MLQLVLKNMMFIGVGGSPAGNSSVWVLDKNQWVLIGGKGVNNSWGLNFPHTIANNFRHTVEEYVYRFVEWNDSLIVGFGEGKHF